MPFDFKGDIKSLVGGIVMIIVAIIMIQIFLGVGKYVIGQLNTTGLLAGVPDLISNITNPITALVMIMVVVLIVGAVVLIIRAFRGTTEETGF